MLQNNKNLDPKNLPRNSSKSRKFFIETYGCQMNISDSELIENILYDLNYKKTNKIKDADAIFLNTCSIRETAEETVHNKLSSLAYLKSRNPKLILGVLGCMAQNLKDELLESKPYVDVILGPDSYRRLPEIIKNKDSSMDHIVDTRLSKYEVYDELFPKRKEGVNAWIPIMRGCDKFCTFCIVPFTRGRERSKSIENVLSEVQDAAKKGFKEVTLLGQNVNSYSTPNGDFPVLLDKVAKVKGIQRVRYTSPHPRDIDKRLLEVMIRHKNICNQVHLPLQAGSDRILKRMNRTYTKQEYLDLVEMIRGYIPDCSLSTDIIVGFPGETQSEFEETLEVVTKVGFTMAFMFKYSPRPGTKAAEYTDQISEDEKQTRLQTLIDLQREISLQRNKLEVGKELDVIIEKESKKSVKQWTGRTESNSWVVFDKNGKCRVGDQVNVKILDAKGVTLFAKLT